MTDAESSKPKGVFPVFLKLQNKKVLVVGGGNMALEKLPALVAAGADVAVVAPEIRPEILALDVKTQKKGLRPAISKAFGTWSPPHLPRSTERFRRRPPSGVSLSTPSTTLGTQTSI